MSNRPTYYDAKREEARAAINAPSSFMFNGSDERLCEVFGCRNPVHNEKYNDRCIDHQKIIKPKYFNSKL